MESAIATASEPFLAARRRFAATATALFAALLLSACVTSYFVAERFAIGSLREAHALAVRSVAESVHPKKDKWLGEDDLDEEINELAATTSVDTVVIAKRGHAPVVRHVGTATPPPPIEGPVWELSGTGATLHAVGRSSVGEGENAVTIVVRQRAASMARGLASLRDALLLAVLPTLLAAAGASWLLANRAMLPARRAYEQQRVFLADVSHELRTPLAALSAHVEVQLSLDGLDAEQRTRLETMARQTTSLTRLVDDLLVLARSENAASLATSAELEADALMESVVADVAVLAERHGVTVRVVAAEERLIDGDPAALQRMLLALIDNAIRHGGPGEVRAATRGSGRQIVYTIEDDGPGVAEADMPRLLARFARGPSRATGSGLGLAIAQGIARAHGGALALARAPAGGLRVEVRLPAGRSG